MKIELKNKGANQHTVTVGRVTMYFSYETCIAFDGPEYTRRAFNPRLRGYSQTTSKHATQMGVKHYPDASSDQAFDAMLQEALSEDAREDA